MNFKKDFHFLNNFLFIGNQPLKNFNEKEFILSFLFLITLGS